MIPTHPPPHLAALVDEQKQDKLKKAKAIRFLSHCLTCTKRTSEVCPEMIALTNPDLWHCEVADP